MKLSRIIPISLSKVILRIPVLALPPSLDGGEHLNYVECGAKARTRNSFHCRLPAMENGRCSLHGGKSTGAKTAEGLARIKLANTKHGFYSKEASAQRKDAHELIKKIRDSLVEI